MPLARKASPTLPKGVCGRRSWDVSDSPDIIQLGSQAVSIAQSNRKLPNVSSPSRLSRPGSTKSTSSSIGVFNKLKWDDPLLKSVAFNQNQSRRSLKGDSSDNISHYKKSLTAVEHNIQHVLNSAAAFARERGAQYSLRSEAASPEIQTPASEVETKQISPFQHCKEKPKAWRLANIQFQRSLRTRSFRRKKVKEDRSEADHTSRSCGLSVETPPGSIVGRQSPRKSPLPKLIAVPTVPVKPKPHTPNSFIEYRRRRSMDENGKMSGNSSVNDASSEASTKTSTSQPAVVAPDSTRRRSNDFDIVCKAARKHHLALEVVRSELEQFRAFLGPDNEDDIMSFEVFLESIRKMLNVASVDNVNPDLVAFKWRQIDKDGSNSLDFEEFLLWRMSVCSAEEIAVIDPTERWLRHLARKHGLPILEVEEYKRMFNEYDTNSSGGLDEEEFKKGLIKAFKLKDESIISPRVLRTFYMEALAISSTRSLGFEAFLVWHTKIFEHGLNA